MPDLNSPLPEKAVPQPSSPAIWLRRVQLPIMLLTLIALAWLLARDFKGAEFQQVLNRISLAGLGIAMLPGLMALLLKGVRLRYVGESLGLELNLWQGIKYQVIAISLASVTPGRAGEFSKIFLLARNQRDKLALGTLAVIVERVFDLLALGLLALSFCLFQLHNQTLSLALVGMVLVLAGLTFGLLWLGGRDIARLQKLIPARVQSLLSQMPAIALHRLGIQALLTLVIWFCEALGQWLILQSAGVRVPLWPVLGINALVAISAILSLLPVGLGTMELSALVLYGSLHVSQAEVLFLIAAARVLWLAPLFALFAGIFLTDRSLFAELNTARQKKPQSA